MTNQINSFISQIQAAGVDKITPTATANGTGALSFGIVNSKSNGKRVSISKALAKAIDITDTVDVIVQVKAGVIHLCSDFSGIEGFSRYNLRGDDRKICYSYELVQFLTSSFGLDFSHHVSHSYINISFTDYNNLPVATIKLNTTTAQLAQSLNEAENQKADAEGTNTLVEEDSFVFDDYEEAPPANSEEKSGEE